MNANKFLKLARDYAHYIALFVMLVVPFVLPRRAPVGIWALGFYAGCGIALQAIPLVLIYNANRIINFSQVAMGLVAGTLFQQLYFRVQFLRWFRVVCPPCVSRLTPGLYALNWWLSLGVSVVLSVLIGYAVYWLVIKRFQNAPRLIVTVATIYLVQILGGIQGRLPSLFATARERESGQIRTGGAAKPPFDFTFTINPTRFHAPEVLTVLVTAAAVVGLILFFRKSSTGVAVRGSSENAPRAQTLGINVDAVQSIIWVFAGFLSGAAALLNVMSVGGGGGGGGISVNQLVRMLAVAIIGGLASIPVTVAAAIVLGILDQAVFWSFGSRTIVDGLLLVIIVVILLLQKYRTSRAEEEQASGWRASREIRPIPKEMRNLPQVRQYLRSGIVVGTIVVLGYPWIMSPSQNNLAAVIMIFAMVGLSLLVLTGWAGQISLGQFAFAAIGGYVAAVTQLPFLIALIVGSIAGAGVAILIGLPALRMRGLHLAISTLAFSLATTQILLNPQYLGKALPSTLNRPKLIGISLENQRTMYYFTLLVLVLVILAVIGLRRSRTARALIACRDNERQAQSFGINLVKARLGAFAVSGFIAALAGALFAYHQHGVKATAYNPEKSIDMFSIAIIGGLGHVAGPVIGNAFYGLLTIGVIPADIAQFMLGMGGLLLLYILPGGLSQLVFGMRDNVLRRIAKRLKMIVPSLLADVRIGAHGRPKAPIAPNTRGGSSVYVPDRYRVDGQWALDEMAAQSEKEKVGG